MARAFRPSYGRLVDRQTGRPVVGVALRPVLRVGDHGLALPPVQSVTGADGRYAIVDVRERAPWEADQLELAGTWDVVDGRGRGRHDLRILDGALGDWIVSAPARVRGRVLRAGEPVVDAVVRVPPSEGVPAASARTDLDGRFELERSPGRIALNIEHTWAEVVLEPGEVADLDLDVARVDDFPVWVDGPPGAEAAVISHAQFRSIARGAPTLVPQAGWAIHASHHDNDRTLAPMVWLSPDANRIDVGDDLDARNAAATRVPRPCPARPRARVSGGPSARDLALARYWRAGTHVGTRRRVAYAPDLGFREQPTDGGLRVRMIGGAAAAAGLRVGDVITAIDGVALAPGPDGRWSEPLTETIEPCQDVAFTVVRDGATRTITVPGTF